MRLPHPEWTIAKDTMGRLRVFSGQSQSDVAVVAGVTQQYISQVEGGQVLPSEKVIRAYAQICGVDPDELLLMWHKVPSDIFAALRKNPSICAALRRQLLSE